MIVSKFICNFILIDKSTISQYKHDYVPKQGNQFGSNMDSVSLRKTNFIMGDHIPNYNTTQNDQNRNVDPRGRPVTALSKGVKAELRKSHFILGNYHPEYTSSNKVEYLNHMYNPDTSNRQDIGKNLRKHNHVLGDTQPNYLSEMHSRYNNPNQTGKLQQVVSTAELQKSHYVFGSTNDPWKTTSQISYGPKDMDNLKWNTKNLTKTNFVLGQDQPELKSVSHQTYIPHLNTGYSQKNKELSQDLRQHHFKLGNDDPSMTSVNHMDFKPLNANDSRCKQTLDHNTLKRSHFSLGDSSQAARDHYDSVYTKTMNNKYTGIPKPVENNNFKSSINITGDNQNTYMTEFKSK